MEHYALVEAVHPLRNPVFNEGNSADRLVLTGQFLSGPHQA